MSTTVRSNCGCYLFRSSRQDAFLLSSCILISLLQPYLRFTEAYENLWDCKATIWVNEKICKVPMESHPMNYLMMYISSYLVTISKSVVHCIEQLHFIYMYLFQLYPTLCETIPNYWDDSFLIVFDITDWYFIIAISYAVLTVTSLIFLIFLLNYRMNRIFRNKMMSPNLERLHKKLIRCLLIQVISS